MLTHPTLDQLNQLGLYGMAKAFGEVIASAEAATLTHAEWLALLLDREMTYRYDKKLAGRLRYARLRHQATVEDVDYRSPRGLDRALFQKLIVGDWIEAHDNLVLCGPTGIGSPVLSATRPVATIARSSISACPSCSAIWRSPAATAATHGC